jgi:hypothetical protein
VGLVFYAVCVVWKQSLWVCLCIANVSACTAEAVVWRLPEPSDSKMSWDPWDSETRIAVLARASSNLLDWPGYPSIVARQRLGKHGGVVFYAVRVVSKESRRLVPTRTSFFLSVEETHELLRYHTQVYTKSIRVNYIYSIVCVVFYIPIHKSVTYFCCWLSGDIHFPLTSHDRELTFLFYVIINAKLFHNTEKFPFNVEAYHLQFWHLRGLFQACVVRTHI